MLRNRFPEQCIEGSNRRLSCTGRHLLEEMRTSRSSLSSVSNGQQHPVVIDWKLSRNGLLVAALRVSYAALVRSSDYGDTVPKSGWVTLLPVNGPSRSTKLTLDPKMPGAKT